MVGTVACKDEEDGCREESDWTRDKSATARDGHRFASAFCGLCTYAVSLLLMTSHPDHRQFIFDSLGAKRPKTSRRSHIRLLYDVLQLSLQRADYPRARRAWSVLVRCKEVDWKSLWNAGVMLVDDGSNEAWHGNSKKLEYLSAMMLQYPEEVRASEPWPHLRADLIISGKLSFKNSS